MQNKNFIHGMANPSLLLEWLIEDNIIYNVNFTHYEKGALCEVTNRFLETSETNKLALIAPRSTINIIQDYKLIEKRKIQMPHSIVGIFKCPNLKCITNSGEEIRSLIDVIDKENIVLKCRYCARTLSTDELVF